MMNKKNKELSAVMENRGAPKIDLRKFDIPETGDDNGLLRVTAKYPLEKLVSRKLPLVEAEKDWQFHARRLR